MSPPHVPASAPSFPVARPLAVTSCLSFSTAPPALDRRTVLGPHSERQGNNKGDLGGDGKDAGEARRGGALSPRRPSAVFPSKQPQFGGRRWRAFRGPRPSRARLSHAAAMRLSHAAATRLSHAAATRYVSVGCVNALLSSPRAWGLRALERPLSLPFQLLSQAPALGGRGVPGAQCRARFEIVGAIRLLKRPATS